MFVVGNANGLMASSATHRGPQTTRPYYIEDKGTDGALVDGDLTVKGTLFVDTIEPVSTTEPVFIRAPNEIGGASLLNNALVIEGGANRVVDGSGLQVSVSTYKPFTRGTINHITGEDVGSYACWGKDTSDNDVRYGDIRMVLTDPTPTNKQSRMNFLVMENNTYTTMLQLDGSQNVVKTMSGARLASDADISANTSITAGTTITAGGTITAGVNISAGATGSVIGRQYLVNGTTAGGGLGGIAINVDSGLVGRLNHDGAKLQLNSASTAPSYPVEIQCNEKTAMRATTDASNNITVQVGASAVPRGGARLQNVDASGTTTYWPSLMKTTSATTNGATVSFTNTAELLSNVVSVFAPYTGYYQFMAQFRASTVGTFDEGTDQITFYADISGGSNSPIIGSINDINSVGSGSDVDITFSGYAFANAGETINLYHIDVGVFTITNGVLFVLWKFMGAGTGLL